MDSYMISDHLLFSQRHLRDWYMSSHNLPDLNAAEVWLDVELRCFWAIHWMCHNWKLESIKWENENSRFGSHWWLKFRPPIQLTCAVWLFFQANDSNWVATVAPELVEVAAVEYFLRWTHLVLTKFDRRPCNRDQSNRNVWNFPSNLAKALSRM